MKAFLLSAGLGTRMMPMTDHTPKCLLSINGTPLLEIWFNLFTRHGINEVLINTHRHHKKVNEFISKYSKDIITENLKKKLCIKIFYEKELLGSAGTLMANRHWVKDDEAFFILYSDNLTDLDLAKMYAFHDRHELPISMGVFNTDAPERCGIAEIDENKIVTNFEEKPKKPKANTAFAGICVADKRLFDLFPRNPEKIRPLDMASHVIPNLKGKIKAYFIEEFLMDIGTPESYQSAQLKWRLFRNELEEDYYIRQ